MAVKIELRVDDKTQDGIDHFVGNTSKLRDAIASLGDEMKMVEHDSAEFMSLQERHSESLRRLSDSVRDSTGKMRLTDFVEKEKEGTRLYEELARRQAAARKLATSQMVDSLGVASQAHASLSEQVRKLNELNITPYGYERFAFRATSALEQMSGKSVAALGAIAVGAVSVSRAVESLVESGDPAIQRFTQSSEQLGKSWDRLSLAFGRSEIITSSIEGLSQSIESLTEITNEGVPTLRGFFSLLIGDTEGAMGAKREIDAIRESISMLGVEAGKVKAGKLLDELDRRRFSDGGKFAEINDIGQLNAMRAAEEKRLMELMEVYTDAAEQKEILADQGRLLADIDARRVALMKQQGDLTKSLMDIEDRYAGRKFDSSRLETVKEVTEEYENQMRQLKKLNETGRLTDEDQKKRLKVLMDLQQRKHQLEKEAVAWVEENERRIQEGKVRSWELERQREEERMQRAKAFAEEQARFQQKLIAERMRALGGESGAASAIQQLDPRQVRETIAKNRVEQRKDQLAEKFKREREEFKNKWGDDRARFDENGNRIDRDDEFNRMLRRQAGERAKSVKQTRFEAFSDFNRGRIGAEEMRQGQSDAFRGVIDAQQRQGAISEETAAAMRGLVENLATQAQSQEVLSREIENLKRTILEQQNALGAQRQRLQRNANQNQGNGRF